MGPNNLKQRLTIVLLLSSLTSLFSGCPTPPELQINIQGPQALLQSGAKVRLQATLTGAQGQIAYEWSAPNAAFDDATLENPSITLPVITTCDEELVVTVKVTEVKSQRQKSASLNLKVGRAWCTFTTANTPSDEGLKTDFITKLTIGENGEVWIGTSDGLNRFDGKTWKRLDSNNSLLSGKLGSEKVYINALSYHNGYLWIAPILAAKDVGAVSFKIGGNATEAANWMRFTSEFFPAANSLPLLPSDRVQDLAGLDRDHIVIATSLGAAVLNTNDNTAVHIGLDNNVQAVAIDDDKNIWLGSGLGSNGLRGVLSYKDANDLSPLLYEHGFYKNNIISTIAPSGNDIYFGAAPGGTGFAGILRAHIESGNYKETVFQDRSNPPANNTRKIVIGANGDAWVATEAGLPRFRPDANGDVKAGTWVFFDNTYAAEGGFTSNNLNDLAYDSANRVLWIASDQGLTRLRIDFLPEDLR